VYSFEFDGTSWTAPHVIFSETPQSFGHFGFSVDLDGDVAIIGHPNSDVMNLTDSGQAMIYRFDGQGWIPEKLLTAPNPDVEAGFGYAVAIDSTYGRVHVGEPFNDETFIDGGAVHTFRDWGSANWLHYATWGSHESKTGARAGLSVSADAGQMVWGEPGNTDPFFTLRAGRIRSLDYGRNQLSYVVGQSDFLPVDHPVYSAPDLELGQSVANAGRFMAASAAVSHSTLAPRVAIYKRTQCSNGVDDDQDGLWDQQDPDCENREDDSEWHLEPDDIVVADNGHPSSLIRVDAQNGTQTILSRGYPLTDLYGVQVRDDGGIWVSDGSSGSMYRVDDRAGEITTVIRDAGLYHPRYFSFESDQSLIVADSVNDSVHRVLTEWGAQFPVSTGGNLTIVIDAEVMPSGQFLASDYASAAVVQIDPTDGSQTILSQYGQFSLVWDLAYQDDEHTYLSDVGLDTLFRVDLKTGGQTQMAQFDELAGIDLDNGSDVVVADGGARSIYRVDSVSYAKTLLSSNGGLDFPMGVAVVSPTYVPEPSPHLGLIAGMAIVPALSWRRRRRSSNASV
jgi:hypothetical protein